MSLFFDDCAGVYDRFMKMFKLDNNDDIIKIFEDIKGKHICDIGGGTGVLADLLERKGNKVTIIDPSVKMTDIAVKRNKNISIISSTIVKCKCEEAFDYIILKDSLHHINDQKETIRKSIKALKNKGYIIIQEFSPSSIQSKLIFAFEWICREKVTPVNEKNLERIMNELGIKGEIIHINKRDYIYLGQKVK